MATTRRIKHLWLFAFGADFLAIAVAYYTTLLIRFHCTWGEKIFAFINRGLNVRDTAALGKAYEHFYQVSAPRIILILTFTLCVLYALRDLYAGRRFMRKRPVIWNVIVANAIALGLFYMYFYVSRNTYHPRSFFVTFIVLNIFYCGLFRILMDKFLSLVRTHSRLDGCMAVLVGDNSNADFICSIIDAAHPHGISISYRMKYDPSKEFDEWLTELGTSVSLNGADMAILAEEDLSGSQIMQVLQLAGRLGIAVKVLSGKLDVLKDQAKIATDMIHGRPLVHFDIPAEESSLSSVRRTFSGMLGLLGTLITLPLTLLIAILIKLTSKGPVLFNQERIGVNRKPFLMHKFRTMHERAQEIQAQVEEFNESGEALFKIKKDPRVTLLGRILRRFSLDELPQLINVIRGDMALVGPRPLPRRDFENYYEEWHYGRHEGVPGLTCLWQVSGRSDVNFHNMCILDLYYLRNRSWVLDLKIALRTIWAVLFARGAY
ncbi:MAG: exopolysaccharide biosynthesis polyprenyl glycosylphosphotransferase [Kiritimatiellae bacterium]|nr:exopolysaccharide biosynthesis polyprenyl glycosylphosphotransferase [Kiritimatiellia bacterium]